MPPKLDLLNRLAASKELKTRGSAGDDLLTDLMDNPDYLRHSSAVINDALKEGFDVLQLPNGNIVTTGTSPAGFSAKNSMRRCQKSSCFS